MKVWNVRWDGCGRMVAVPEWGGNAGLAEVVKTPAVVHGVEVAHLDGVEKLQGTAHHLLSQAGVDGEHGVVNDGVVVFDVAENGEEELFHLVGGDFHPVYVGGVGREGEIPVVAVAGVEEYRAVAKGEDGADPDIG